MTENQFKTPILFTVFNRPDPTRRVFEVIRKMKPVSLYIVADGPRSNKSDDLEKCRKVREIVSNVDWPCDIKKIFREKNLGCKHSVSSGLDWFFKNVEEGIIFEDDDLPDISFFQFCQELLEKYRNDTRVMHISGNNFQKNNSDFKIKESYYFSLIPHIWGWASWRRAWEKYSFELKQWPEVKKRRELHDIFKNNSVAFFWGNMFQSYYEEKGNSYDGQWALACLHNRGLSVTPAVNLVANIGFDADATHVGDRPKYADETPSSISFPLKHCEKIENNKKADEYVFKHVFEINYSWKYRIKLFLKSKFTRLYVFMKKLYYKIFLGEIIEENADSLVF